MRLKVFLLLETVEAEVHHLELEVVELQPKAANAAKQ
jgi:hypothetical protein